MAYTMTRFRCDCGKALIKKDLLQKTEMKGKGTFKIDGQRVRKAGKKLVCPDHGTKKYLYH